MLRTTNVIIPLSTVLLCCTLNVLKEGKGGAATLNNVEEVFHNIDAVQQCCCCCCCCCCCSSKVSGERDQGYSYSLGVAHAYVHCGVGGRGGGVVLMGETISVKVISLLTETFGFRIGGWLVHYGSRVSSLDHSVCWMFRRNPFTHRHTRRYSVDVLRKISYTLKWIKYFFITVICICLCLCLHFDIRRKWTTSKSFISNLIICTVFLLLVTFVQQSVSSELSKMEKHMPWH